MTAEAQHELPYSPPGTRNVLSPPPQANLHMAGHTPLRVPAQLAIDSSPTMSNLSDKLGDTLTRANTEHNISMVQTDGTSEGDSPLKGPLNMPELPNKPGEENFTLDCLAARLKEIEDHPDDHQPMVLRQPSPGAYDDSGDSTIEEKKLEPLRDASRHSGSVSKGSASNNLSPQDSRTSQTSESRKQQDHDHGGIKLRKRPSTNFGAPLGQLNFRKF